MMCLSTLLLLLVVFVGQSTVSSNPQQVSPLPVLEQILWERNMDGVSLYRIPVITYTPGGNLLAAVEARKSSGGDAGPKFLTVRRSTDKGYNWSPQNFIVNDGSTYYDGLNLGVVLVDDIMSSIYIFYSVCAHYEKCNTSSALYVKSVDDGITWEKPVNVSAQIGTKMFAPGPGYGIQKKYHPHKGRLIVCGHGTLAGDGMFCLLSDDHGKTWRNGGDVKSIPYNKPKVSGDFQPDECQPMELPDGSVVVNMRNQAHYHCHCRIIATSYDGADTFDIENVVFDPALNDSGVAAGALYHRGVMYFSNPNHRTSRINLTLQWSYNNGTTWAGQLQIWPKSSTYSCMTTIPGGLEDHVYIIYEKGISSLESISLVRVSLYGGLL
ncbi:sialidase-1-like [Amphiura filiformis]|uniref:sialidase-1-like n=1 Tax=Amphiura filiformis TaxID=82378 RepID=UPI003B212085